MTSESSFMRPSVLVAFLTGLVVAALALRKRKANAVPILADLNKRYDIDEYIGDEQL